MPFSSPGFLPLTIYCIKVFLKKFLSFGMKGVLHKSFQLDAQISHDDEGQLFSYVDI